MDNQVKTKLQFTQNRLLITIIILLFFLFLLFWILILKNKIIFWRGSLKNNFISIPQSTTLKDQTFLSIEDLPEDIKKLTLLDKDSKILNIWSYIDNNKNKTINVKIENSKPTFQLFELYIKFAINNNLALIQDGNFYKDGIINLTLFNSLKKEEINIVFYDDEINKKSIINLVFNNLKQ